MGFFRTQGWSCLAEDEQILSQRHHQATTRSSVLVPKKWTPGHNTAVSQTQGTAGDKREYHPRKSRRSPLKEAHEEERRRDPRKVIKDTAPPRGQVSKASLSFTSVFPGLLSRKWKFHDRNLANTGVCNSTTWFAKLLRLVRYIWSDRTGARIFLDFSVEI